MARDYSGDMNYYQEQLDKAGITLDIGDYIGCTASQLQGVVDSAIRKEASRLRFNFSKRKVPSYNDKECVFPLENGNQLVLSMRDCIEVFQTVSDGITTDKFDRDDVVYALLEAYGLEE